MKKTFFGLIIVFTLLFANTSLALEGDDPAAKTQFMITASHIFWESDDSADFSISGYSYAFFYYDLNDDYKAIVPYIGPKITFVDFSIYILAVGYADPYAWYAGPSLWLEYDGPFYGFIQGDYLAAVASTSHEEDIELPQDEYYGYAELSVPVGNISLGLAYEICGLVEEDDLDDIVGEEEEDDEIDDSQPYQSAIGPKISFGEHYSLWAFYDFTPNIDDYDYYGVRFIINIF